MSSRIETNYLTKPLVLISLQHYADISEDKNKFNDSAVLIISKHKSISEIEQKKICAHIVTNGCRYAVCFGFSCRSWDTALDSAYLEYSGDQETEDDVFIMTAWDEDETIEDALSFFLHLTIFDDWSPSRYVVLSIDPDDEKMEDLLLRIKKELSGTKPC